MTVKDAIVVFEKEEAEALAAIEAPDTREVIGLLTQAYALRRSKDELEQRRQDLRGE